MSIALFNAITGLSNFQKVLDTVGNNIANISTPGYKRSTVTFKELMSQTIKGASAAGSDVGGTNPIQFGLGSTIGSTTKTYTQGNLETTGRATDLAITGRGFFIVKNGGSNGYTRNGSFGLDNQGNLVDCNGYYVQGWMAKDGKVNNEGTLENLTIPLGGSSIAKATSNVIFDGNLDASQDIYAPGPPETGGIYTTESTVYDSLGNPHTVEITYTKVTPGSGISSQWDWSATIDGTAAGTGSLAYDTNGKMDEANSTQDPTITLALTNGADDLSIGLNFTKTTQLSSNGKYSIVASEQDGYESGVLQSFAVDKSGIIVGTYSNGMTQTLGQLAVADFTNPEGLEVTDGGILRATSNSGIPQIGTATTGSFGSMSSGTLELSNVDLSSEFTKMIIAQRAFQANSRVVSVMDQVMEEMANLKR